MSTGVGVMARAPSSGGKTRLAPHLPPARLLALRVALLTDTLTALAAVPGVTIFFTPDDAEAEIAALVGRTHRSAPTPALLAQGSGDFGARMLRALQFLLNVTVSDTVVNQPRCLTPKPALLIGSDIPLLTPDHLREAEDTLRARGGLVLGPADDGGYYLIGMTEPRVELFEGIEWGTGSVLTDTLRAAERAGVEARLARSAYDVDTIDDLLRLERDLKWAPSPVGAAMRRWFSDG